jgi:uncharacterized membrane protein YphA (DoxX/SURF4 family)
MLLRRIARPMLAAAFIGQGIEALRNPKTAAEAARPTLEGLRALPDPVGSGIPSDAETVAKMMAIAQIAGGLLLASGRVPRLASAALAATVVPANLGTHMFWAEPDPEAKAAKRRDFLSDVSMLGGLVIASADTAGKPSLGWRGRRAAEHLTEAFTAALPIGGSAASAALFDNDLTERLHTGAERGRQLAAAAAGKAAPVLEAARDRGTELAEIARERGKELSDTALERGRELSEVALERGTELAQSARGQSDELVSEARKRTRAWRGN